MSSPAASSSNTLGSRFQALRTFDNVRFPTFKADGCTEEDVLKLRDAKFLTGDISHRLPAQGQAIPSPQPDESVVFMSHFLRWLGFPMDPFVRGLMFYYGLEFHDLAPESILHVSSFIVVCEAFLGFTPHF